MILKQNGFKMDISKQQKKKLRKISQEFGLDFIILHGSKAANRLLTKDSDLDIAIYKRRGIKADQFFEIYSQIAQVFSGEDVDIKTLNAKAPLFKYQVVRDGMLLFGDRTAYNEFKAFIFKEYFDSASLFLLEKQLLKKTFGWF